MTSPLLPVLARRVRLDVASPTVAARDPAEEYSTVKLATPVRVLILKADRIYAEALQQAVQGVLPAATFRCSTQSVEAREILAQGAMDLMITGVNLADGNALELLGRYCGDRRGKPRVLVITARREQRVLATLRALPIEGVFDPSADGSEQLEQAIRAVAGGGSYWSVSVLRRLTACLAPNAICRLLTPSEQTVLSVIGDGSDDVEAAQRLGLKPTTIASVRRQLHRKLNVQHKGALVRLAVQHGFVRVTAEGVIPGFASDRESPLTFRPVTRN